MHFTDVTMPINFKINPPNEAINLYQLKLHYSPEGTGSKRQKLSPKI